jgi:hypothetical protein
MPLLLRRALAYAGAALAGAAAWVGAQFVSTSLELYPGTEVQSVLYVVISVAATAGAIWGTLRWLRKRGAYSPILVSSKVRRIVVVAYLLTWAFGAPAAESEVTGFAVAEYKRMQASGRDRVFPSHPWIKFTMALPLAPGLVLTYHEYQLAGLYGWGGWGLHIWYGVGARQIAGLPVWLS